MGIDDVPEEARFLFLNQEICDARIADLSQVKTVSDAQDCMDWYWHNGHFDEGHLKFLKLGYRLIDTHPDETGTYTTLAWILASKWVNWHENPSNEFGGEKRFDEAMALLERGRLANPEDAEYHRDCADTIDPFARHYRPDLLPYVAESYELALRYEQKPSSRLRIFLSFGISYKRQKKWVEAFEKYKEALLIDPENRVALNDSGFILRKLDRLDESLQFYEHLMASYPNFIEGMLGKARTLLAEKESEKARAVYENVLQLRSRQKEALWYLNELNKTDGSAIQDYSDSPAT
ncbi:MAG: hypothetical protein JWQ35_2420 [Bacteriovoracaceae bacterium]|nr:hypothetical protein [Bacteriovoracaceae bacterium]